jgi:hypothetical protein
MYNSIDLTKIKDWSNISTDVNGRLVQVKEENADNLPQLIKHNLFANGFKVK